MKANDIRKGIVVMHNNQPHRVMEFRHHTPGNLRAMVQTKLRNLLSGNQTEVRYSSTEEIEEADVVTFDASYLYADQNGYHFMNASNYEEVSLSAELIGEGKFYIQEQMEVTITTWNGQPLGVELPEKVTLTIVETPPEIRGATASNSPKPATTDTGLQLMVPPFIKNGEKIIVSTGDGKYVSRADS